MREEERERTRTPKNERKERRSRFNSTKMEPEAKERRGRTKRLTRPRGGDGRGGLYWAEGLRRSEIEAGTRHGDRSSDICSTLITPDSGEPTERPKDSARPPRPPANRRPKPRTSRLHAHQPIAAPRAEQNAICRAPASRQLPSRPPTSPRPPLRPSPTTTSHRHLASRYSCTPKAKIRTAVLPHQHAPFESLHPHHPSLPSRQRQYCPGGLLRRRTRVKLAESPFRVQVHTPIMIGLWACASVSSRSFAFPPLGGLRSFEKGALRFLSRRDLQSSRCLDAPRRTPSEICATQRAFACPL
ncbi:hypothetical protein C8Q77DRAFT_543177 [Trametes polyzona]|nr:hypothetical protein C8Q77DRAFT_543177 [Trametes polyzona]